MKKIIILLILAVSSFHSHSQNLNLVGIGLYKELSANYFYGALYALEQMPVEELLQSSTPKKLVMRVTKNSISARRFYRLWNQTLAINNSEEDLAVYENDILSFTYLLKSRLKRADEIVIEEIAGFTVASVNGQQIQSFTQSGFINVLLKGWIGRLPPSSVFKDEVLGLAPDNKDNYLLDFESLIPNSERIAVVKGWLKPDNKVAVAQLPIAPAKIPEAEITVIETATEIEANKGEDDTQQQEVARLAIEQQERAQLALKKRKLQQQARLKQQQAARTRLAALKELQKVQTQYFKKTIAQANKFVRYPDRAQRYQQEGYIRVKISVNRQGEVLSSQILEASQYPLLNKAALKAITSASPFPVLPGLIDGSHYELTLPFNFKAS